MLVLVWLLCLVSQVKSRSQLIWHAQDGKCQSALNHGGHKTKITDVNLNRDYRIDYDV
jgi:hypothetical protein